MKTSRVLQMPELASEALRLREACAAWVEENPRNIREFLVDSDCGISAAEIAGPDPAAACVAYAARLRDRNTWGDHVCLVVLCKLLQCSIR